MVKIDFSTVADIKNDPLIEIESHYRQILNSLPVAIYTCDGEGYITQYNKGAVELWGRKPEIGVDRWCGSWKMYDPSGQPISLEDCPMALAIREGRPVTGEEIIIERPDGQKRVVVPHLRPVFGTTGELVGIVNTLEDVTERKKNEEMQARLAAIVNTSNDAIIGKTLNGIITSWNEAAEKMFGYSANEIIGKSITTLIPPHRAGEEEMIISQVKKGKLIGHFETERVGKGGRLLNLSLSISPIKDKNGRIIGVSKIARDITEQKQSEKLRKINEQLEKSNSELEQFAYIASHDLQEPLRKIQAFLGLLKTKKHEPETFEKYFSKVTTSAQRMSRLINDILNYSRLAVPISQFQHTDLNYVLKEVVTDFELLIEQKNVVIDSGELPVVMGVPQQLHQLFANLVSNAIKFCENKPEIRITSRLLTAEEVAHTPGLAENKDYFQISFKDNGIGFDTEHADEVFVIFKRLNSPQAYSGTGIGLALCKKITENHGGIIKATGKKGMGAEITVILPASIVAK
jgi:PAS domain S-box-containing protein